MNIQQLRYVVAIDRFRNFARAAEACNISQPTLSAMLVKFEEELDVRIFERTNKLVKPTTVGEKIISQAQKALMETDRIAELISEGRGAIGGRFVLSVGPTIAPYLLPKFIRHYRKSYPSVDLTIKEMKTNHMLEALLNGELDAAVAIADNSRQHENMWIMKEAQCLRDSAFSFCKARSKGHHIYEAGSIETLIRIVDENGGYTIIPEMHLPFLSEKQRENVREIKGDYLSQRRISLYIKDDYIRERMLNTVVDALRSFLPQRMLGEGIVKYGIKL